MQTQKVKVEDLKEFPNNVRIHTKRNLETLKNSLTAYGQYRPLVVQKSTMYIVCGNGLYQAAKALGWKELDCLIMDLDDDRAKTLLILDNRSSDLSQNDEKNLLDMLQNLDKDLLELTGYDDKELDKMLSFQEGTLFGDKDKEKKPKKEKQEKKEVPISADDQISFVLMGYPFNLADPDRIKLIKYLMDKFMESNIEVKCETIEAMWSAMIGVLQNAVGETPQVDVESDRG